METRSVRLVAGPKGTDAERVKAARKLTPLGGCFARSGQQSGRAERPYDALEANLGRLLPPPTHRSDGLWSAPPAWPKPGKPPPRLITEAGNTGKFAVPLSLTISTARRLWGGRSRAQACLTLVTCRAAGRALTLCLAQRAICVRGSPGGPGDVPPEHLRAPPANLVWHPTQAAPPAPPDLTSCADDAPPENSISHRGARPATTSVLLLAAGLGPGLAGSRP